MSLVRWISIPVIAFSLAYYFKDELLRMLRWKTVAIIYYHYNDAYPAYLLHKTLYPWSDVYKGSEENPIPTRYKYRLYILLGGQAVNPIYRKFVETGDLPLLQKPGDKVIKRIGDYVFIAGYEAPDTYEAVKEFIEKYLKR